MTQKKTTRRVNDTGWSVEDQDCRLKDFKFYEENGSILLWATVNNGEQEETGMQYLTPTEAMEMSKALKECALKVFEHSSYD